MNKKYKISIIGLGYVGLQVALAFSKKYQTVGYDISQLRIKKLLKNIDETEEVTSYELKNSKINFTNDISILKENNFHILAVPTPINSKKEPDLKIIIKATKDIASIIKDGDIIVYESTVYPGLTEEICIPILEKYSNLKNNKNFFVGYSPERINPGDKIYSYQKINKIVSAQNIKTLNILKKIYQSTTSGKVHKVSSIKVAEAAKVIENTQRDLNVALINEFSQIFHKMNIDTYEVLNAASTKWNFLNFKPGLVGGHCIGVDPYYLTHKSKKIGINPQLILSGRKINDNMAFYIADIILKNFNDNKKLNISIMGVTFKENCPDIRNSKVLDLVNFFIKKKHKVSLFDPYIKEVRVNQSTKIKIKPLNYFEKSDVIIIAVIHSQFIKLPSQFFTKKIANKGIIFDVKGKFGKLKRKSTNNYKYLTL